MCRYIGNEYNFKKESILYLYTNNSDTYLLKHLSIAVQLYFLSINFNTRLVMLFVEMYIRYYIKNYHEFMNIRLYI